MFGKRQIIKYEAKAYNSLPGSSEPLFVKIKPVIQDLKAQIEVPINHFAFILKGGNYGDPVNSGIYDIFADKFEAKNFKKGHTLEIIFTQKDKALSAKWAVEGDSTSIFVDEKTNYEIEFNFADGQFSIKVDDPLKFHREVVGDKEIYRISDFEEEALLTVKNTFLDMFFNFINNNGVDYTNIIANRNQISKLILNNLNNEVASKGYKFTSFIIDHIDIDYSKAKGVRETRNEKEEYTSELSKKFREEIHENEDREHKKKMEEAELASKTAIETTKAKYGGNKNNNDEDKCESFVYCQTCATKNPTTNTYCKHCGNKLKKD